MKKEILLCSGIIIILIGLMSASVVAHEEKQVDNFNVEFFIDPTDTPAVGERVIIGFEVSNIHNKPVTHVDAYLNISKEETNLLSDYYMHSHTGDFSLIYKFDSVGNYSAALLVQPSPHYEGENFNPFIVNFDINVVEGTSSHLNESNSNIVVISVIVIIISIVVLVWAIKKGHKE